MRYPVIHMKAYKKKGYTGEFYSVYYAFEHVTSYSITESEQVQVQELQRILTKYVAQFDRSTDVSYVENKYYIVAKNLREEQVKVLANFILDLLVKSNYHFEDSYVYELQLYIHPSGIPLVLGMKRYEVTKQKWITYTSQQDTNRKDDELVFMPLEDMQYPKLN